MKKKYHLPTLAIISAMPNNPLKLLQYFYFMSFNMDCRYAINYTDIYNDFKISRTTLYRYLEYLKECRAIRSIEPSDREKRKVAGWENYHWIEVANLSEMPNWFLEKRFSELHSFSSPFENYENETGGFWNTLKTYNFGEPMFHQRNIACVTRETSPTIYRTEKNTEKEEEKFLAKFSPFKNSSIEEIGKDNNKDIDIDTEIDKDIDCNISIENNNVLDWDTKDIPPISPFHAIDQKQDISIEENISEYIEDKNIEYIQSKNIADNISEYIPEYIEQVKTNGYSSINEMEDFLTYANVLEFDQDKRKSQLEDICTQEEEKINLEQNNDNIECFLAYRFYREFEKQLFEISGYENKEIRMASGDTPRSNKQSHRQEIRDNALRGITSASAVAEPDRAKILQRQKLAEEKEAKAKRAIEKNKVLRFADAKGFVGRCDSIENIKDEVKRYTAEILFAFIEKSIEEKGKRISKPIAKDKANLKRFIEKAEANDVDALEMMNSLIEIVEKKNKILCLSELLASWHWDIAFDLVVNKSKITTNSNPKWGEVQRIILS